jgi:hypothetical protein
MPERHPRRRRDRGTQHRAGRLADRHYVDRIRGSQSALDVRSGQRLLYESAGVCCHERRAHDSRQIVAKIRERFQ